MAYWMLPAAGAAVNVIGNLLSRPSKDTGYDPNRIFALIRQKMLAETEKQAERARSTSSLAAQARGLTGGASAQVMGEAEGPIREAVAPALSELWANILEKSAALKEAQKERRRQWTQDFAGDIGSAAAGIGAFLQAQKNAKELQDKLTSLGDTFREGMRDMRGQVSKPTVSSGSLHSVDYSPTGGDNPLAHIDFASLLRKRDANQYSYGPSWTMPEF